MSTGSRSGTATASTPTSWSQALSEALGKTQEGARSWLDKAEDDFKSLLTVENFARWIREYLDSRGPNHRIVFLVDEIGQFIGQDTHLMLNLQTITENLGTACGGRAWVVVTSQEDIDAVLGEVRAAKANDFSKIQGRFKTRLSLSSANVDEVIQKRLLGKAEAARSALADRLSRQGRHPQEPAQLQQRRHDLQALCRRAGLRQRLPLRPLSVPARAEGLRGHPPPRRHRPAPGPRRALHARRLPVRRRPVRRRGRSACCRPCTASTRPSRASSKASSSPPSTTPRPTTSWRASTSWSSRPCS